MRLVLATKVVAFTGCMSVLTSTCLGAVPDQPKLDPSMRLEDFTAAKEAALRQRGAEIITAFPEDFQAPAAAAASGTTTAAAAAAAAAAGGGTAAAPGAADSSSEEGEK
jgi:hypothetical protein